MQLMTKQLQAEFAKHGDQDIPNPLIVAKYFNPVGSATWYAISYDKPTNTIFCYCTGMDYDELGYTSLDELEEIDTGCGIGIERDLYFTPLHLDDIKKRIAHKNPA